MSRSDQENDADRVLRDFCGYRMKRAFNVLQADLSRTLKPLKLRMVTYSALVVICDTPGIRQSKLADALSIERPNLVMLLDELEGVGLIKRDRVPSDRRAYALWVTEQGKTLCETATQAVREHNDRMTKGFTATERAGLHSALSKIENSGT